MTEKQEQHLWSTKEDDLVHQSTKKIKEDGSSVMDVEMTQEKGDAPCSQNPEPKVSYRDKVMETEAKFELQPAEIVRMVTEELFLDMEFAKKQ
ncbi:hydroxymethylbilane synthase [Sesbania bispinosa]|nr:hydroxymethylbilane synthase [Sesbania bispinosa]